MKISKIFLTRTSNEEILSRDEMKSLMFGSPGSGSVVYQTYCETDCRCDDSDPFSKGFTFGSFCVNDCTSVQWVLVACLTNNVVTNRSTCALQRPYNCPGSHGSSIS